jgi:hypothetical protein
MWRARALVLERINYAEELVKLVFAFDGFKVIRCRFHLGREHVGEVEGILIGLDNHRMKTALLDGED